MIPPLLRHSPYLSHSPFRAEQGKCKAASRIHHPASVARVAKTQLVLAVVFSFAQVAPAGIGSDLAPVMDWKAIFFESLGIVSLTGLFIAIGVGLWRKRRRRSTGTGPSVAATLAQTTAPVALISIVHPSQNFDVFLSHNSKDKKTVRQLAEALKKRGLSVWLDEWELVPGRPWQDALEQIVATTKAAAVLVAEDCIGPWQDREMRICLNEFVRRSLPVIPVLPGAPTEPELPMFLKQFAWVDLRSGLTKEGLDLLQWGITGKKP